MATNIVRDRGPLGTLLYNRRAKLGISQDRAALQLDTNRETYRSWELGKEVPKHTRWIEPLTDWLGVPQREVVHAIGLIDDDEWEILRAALGGYHPLFAVAV
jgi:transcriptional regulator with XRE-family HTH domain